MSGENQINMSGTIDNNTNNTVDTNTNNTNNTNSIIDVTNIVNSKVEPNHVYDAGIGNLLAINADECQIQALAHAACYLYYKRWNVRLQVPIIALSTVSGAGNFISSTFSAYKDFIIYIIGAISLFVAFLSSVQKFMEFDRLVEGHRIAALSWDKYYDTIRGHLMIDVKNRGNEIAFFEDIKSRLIKLKERSPFVPPRFFNVYKKESLNVKPYYVDRNIIHVQIYKPTEPVANTMPHVGTNVTELTNDST